MPSDDARYLDWRWAAGIAGTLILLGGGMIVSQHTTIEEQRDAAQEARLDSLSRRADMQDAALQKLPVMDVKLSVIQASLEELKKSFGEQQSREEHREPAPKK